MKDYAMRLGSFFLVGCLLVNTAGILAGATPSSSHFQPIVSTRSKGFPAAITASTTDPFYALIATPLAVSYTEKGERTVLPLYVKDLAQPSKAVQRTEEEIGVYADYTLAGLPAKQASLLTAVLFWQHTNTVLMLQDDTLGYDLGVVAVPIASYLDVPVIVTDTVDANVTAVLTSLGVTQLYVCGTLTVPDGYAMVRFTQPDQITSTTIQVIKERFGGQVQYITMTNPLDIQQPHVLDVTSYKFSGTTPSALSLPSQTLTILLKGSSVSHTFIVPDDYKYARLTFDLRNLNSENTQLLGDKMFLMLYNPMNETCLYTGTSSGSPVLDKDGNIIEDRLHFESIIYDQPGTYSIQVLGNWFARTEGAYTLNVTVEKLDSPIVPLMDNISSVAPYLTAYHQGVVFANTSFAFAADDTVLHNGTTCPGMSQPGG
ncbi:MAG TPA: hypothetical protein VMT57_00905, partial [Candidatus Thermoplasmatota archaeon]|nr:hypothetical protein [Candidatus Thermoplasmatota archaeon]